MPKDVPDDTRARRRPALLQMVGAGFLGLALLHGVMLSGGILSSHAQPPPTVLLAQMPEQDTAEPAAGPEQMPEGGGSATAGGAFDTRCDPHLLQAIQERRRQLDARAAELAQQARMLEVIEKRASELLHALQETQDTLKAGLAAADEVADAEVARLVAIYESMKPKDAARIFEAMSPEIAAGFIRRMRETRSALIMANLDADHAYAITLTLANRGRETLEE